MAESLRRFSFAAGPLSAYRPLLGPTFACLSAAPESARMELPVFVQLVLQALKERLERRVWRIVRSPCGWRTTC